MKVELSKGGVPVGINMNTAYLEFDLSKATLLQKEIYIMSLVRVKLSKIISPFVIKGYKYNNNQGEMLKDINSHIDSILNNVQFMRMISLPKLTEYTLFNEIYYLAIQISTITKEDYGSYLNTIQPEISELINQCITILK